MSEETEENKTLLPHHEQLPLCTTRKPYRQGRKLTAVKAYTITSESNHLLVFGVPSINLRQETRALFLKFGKLKQFIITTDYPNEKFTDTYHAVYENIQSARAAKKSLDTRNFYGGSLHICYAPELETLEETRFKLFKRQKDVIYRLRYLQNDVKNVKNDNSDLSHNVNSNVKTQNQDLLNVNFENNKNNCSGIKERLNMGEINTICVGKQIRDVVFDKRKRKYETGNAAVIEKQFRPCFIQNEIEDTIDTSLNDTPSTSKAKYKINRQTDQGIQHKKSKLANDSNEIEVIDFTSTEKETLSNINEGLNYNKFGNEVIRSLQRPVHKIVFNLNSNKKVI